jgi:hypothetical protein
MMLKSAMVIATAHAMVAQNLRGLFGGALQLTAQVTHPMIGIQENAHPTIAQGRR